VNATARRSLLGGAVALSLLMAACGSDSNSSSDTTAAAETTAAGAETTAAGAATTAGEPATTGAEAPDLSKLSATLNASGATFPQAFYEDQIAAFKEAASGVTINYGGGGSGKGRQDLADQVVDWAGSDGVIKPEDLPKFKGGDVLYFPTVLAPITLSYKLDGVDKLQLTPAVVAKIFQRQITNWNDPAIAADNPDAKLPDQAITVAVRADGSGTTENFTKFLDAAVGTGGDGTWTLKSGSTVQWPADVQAGQGNSGVAQIISSTPGAIGYVDLSDAKAANLQFANVQNKAGKFIEPTLEATSAAAENIEVKPDLTFFTGWADGDASYPIAAQTWILAYKNQTDKAKGEATKAWINYVLTDGQDAANAIDFAQLPDTLKEKAIAQLDQLVIPS
jgi:phosphate transport system substrate-binding protein